MNPDEPNAAAKEFLLTDYHQLNDSLWKNELPGETRVAWVIRNTSGGGAGEPGSKFRSAARSTVCGV